MLRFETFGFPVSVHWLFWLVCFFLGNGFVMKSAADFFGQIFLGILLAYLGFLNYDRQEPRIPGY